MFLHRVPKLILWLTLLILIAACAAPGVSPDSGTEATAPEVQEVQMWVGTNDTADCVIDVAVNSFNEQSDTIEVLADKKADMINAVRPALAAGAGPDLVQTHGPAFVAEFALADQLLPLDDFVADFGWDELFVPWALDLGRIDGKLYSLPQELETVVLYYNKTLFEANGWEPPTTMDELVALADTIADAGIIPFAGQAGECQACNEWYFTEFVNKIAGPDKVYQALKGDIAWDDPDFVLSIETMNEMMQKGHWMGAVENFLAADFTQFSTVFAEGEAAMNMEGTWFYGREAEYFGEGTEHGNEWDWVPMPSATGDTIYSIGLGGTMSINRSAANPEAAAEFLTHYFSPEIQARLFSECRLALGPIKISLEQLGDVDPRMAAIFADFSTASEEGRYGYTTWTFWPPKSDAFIYEEIEKVWVGDMTVEEYLQGLNEIYQEEMEAGEAMAVPDRN